ncbi:MAG TPA: ABC transporter substrate-binding protein [Solirubrobacteraceae bacterium]|nr:ABC transporter substrate-binding protein [Solirubrobacteraceae bacterium]
MRSTLRTLLGLLAVLVLALGAAACGGDDDEESGGTTPQAEGTPQGGNATINLTSFPDYMDPALSYTLEGWNSLWTVYTPLLSYRHAEGAEGAELIPGLAEALPEISEDGLTYTLKLRDGLKFSDGTDVKASDFEHTIKRVLNLESGGSAFYLGIEGAEEYVKRGRARGDITGIEADDATGEITITLKEPDGSFQYVLAMDFAGIVPGDTPFENLTKNPPPGVGPFKIENMRQSRGYELVKNDQFAQIPEIPEATLDKVTVEVVKNQERQTQDIITNKVDWAIDPPLPDQLRTVKDQYKDRFEEYVTNSTYYFFMNERVKPFDDANVRKAVNFAIDKRALARLFGGLLEPGCNFLPPGMKGYEKIDPCPYGDPNAAPNVEEARKLVREAGVEGTKVKVFGNDEDPSRPVAEYLSEVLNDIGFDAEPNIVEASVYFTTIGNQKTRAQIGFANWFQDFPHPRNFMFLVDGDSIQNTNNQNFGNVDDPEVNKLLDEANANANLEEAAPQYAEADRLLVDKAHVAPYGHRKLANFVSERVDFENCTITHPVYELDLTQLCLTSGGAS